MHTPWAEFIAIITDFGIRRQPCPPSSHKQRSAPNLPGITAKLKSRPKADGAPDPTAQRRPESFRLRLATAPLQYSMASRPIWCPIDAAKATAHRVQPWILAFPHAW